MAILENLDTTTILVFLIVFCVTYYYLTSPKNLPPGPRPIPFFGNVEFYRKGNRIEQFTRFQEKYGDVFCMYVGSNMLVVLNGYDVIHDAYVLQKDCFSHRPNYLWWVKQIHEEFPAGNSGMDDHSRPFKGWCSGIFLSSGQVWKDLRRFSLQSMRDFGMGKKSVEEKVQDEVTALLNILSQNEGKKFGFHKYMDIATGNIICGLVFGQRYEYDDPKFHELMKLLNDVVKSPGSLNPFYAVPLLRMLPSSQKMAKVAVGYMDRLCRFVEQMVKDHENTYDPNNIRDFIDLYIQMKCQDKEQSNKAYTLQNFLRLIVDLFLAGTETTSTTINWALLYMMKHPEVQKKCHEEIDKNIGRGRMIKFSDRNKLTYIEATINEVQRLSPIVPFAIPHCTLYDTKLAGYNIPKNSIVLANLNSVHKDPRYWDDVDTFKPERFLDDQGRLIKTDALIPFSTGPRICAGETLARMELIMYFANVLQNFTIKKPEGATLNFKGFIGATYFPLPYELIAERR